MAESKVKGAERSELLQKAYEYCDVKTGRVDRMIPEELTSELRRRQLMTGIFLGDGKPCKYLARRRGGLFCSIGKLPRRFWRPNRSFTNPAGKKAGRHTPSRRREHVISGSSGFSI